MPSTYSPDLRIELIGAGEQAGTWNTTTNTNLGTLIEDAISGYVSVSVTSANQALTANNGVADQARNAAIALTTTTTANFAVYTPPASKQYTIRNTTAYVATIYNSTVLGNTTTAGAGVAIPAGKTMTVWTDGTDFRFQNTHLIGTVVGNVTGDVTGNLTGNVTGNVTGNLTGNVTGNVTGNLTGNVTGGDASVNDLTLSGSITEGVFTITDGVSVDLNPANGTVQVWTLGANRSPTATSFAAGQSMTLMVNDGTAYTITWPSVTWVGGTAPVLATSGFTVFELWKVGTTLYGTLVGSVA